MVGLRDVARHAGVSMPTASRVLSGSSYPVTAELRQRVLDAAAQLDYVPNRQAQALISGNRGGVGVLVGDVGDPYFAEILHGIYDVAVSENLLVTICSTERNVARELEYFRMLQANRTEIVILAGSGLDDPEYKKDIAARTKSFLGSGGRVVSLGDPGTGVSHVLTDNVLGGELLGRHLADLGHREIAVLAGDPRVRSTIDRIEGLRRGLSGSVHVLHGEQSRAGGTAMAVEALRDHPEVTALVGSADQMAIGALRLLAEWGVSVPESLSVAGFNDIEAAADVGLTTVRLPLRGMGSTAMKLALAGRVERELREEQLPVDLVVRWTTSRRRPPERAELITTLQGPVELPMPINLNAAQRLHRPGASAVSGQQREPGSAIISSVPRPSQRGGRK